MHSGTVARRGAARRLACLALVAHAAAFAWTARAETGPPFPPAAAASSPDNAFPITAAPPVPAPAADNATGSAATLPVPAADNAAAPAATLPMPAADNISGPAAPAAAPSSPAGRPEGPLPSDEELAAGGAVIGDIVVRNENIFDLADPKEDNRLFRLANALHARTRPWLIRNQLLFRTGDRYDRRLIDESERILRANGYFYDARIRPVAVRDGRVDIEVFTRDVWTLRPGISFGRQGGANTSRFEFSDSNLLGYGVGVGIAHSSSPDRRANSAFVESAHLLGSWYQTSLLYSENSDGRKKSARLERPFYSLDSRRAGGASYVDDLRIDSIFGRPGVAGRFRTHSQQLKPWAGWSDGLSGGSTTRFLVGFTRDASRFERAPDDNTLDPVPPDRVLAYPWVGVEFVQDDFEKATNRDQIMRTEDFYRGTQLRGTLGHSSGVFGADRRAIVFAGGLRTNFRADDAPSLFVDGTADGRFEGGAVRDATFSANGRFYMPLSESWLVFSLLSGSLGVDLDEDHELVLGGENGLRGYPRRYQAGDRSFLYSLEARYYTDYYPFRLARVGAALFFDMGRAWGEGFAKAADRGLLRNVGAGIRLGLTRSGLGNVIHLDAAFPLDGDPTISRVQFLVTTKKSF